MLGSNAINTNDSSPTFALEEPAEDNTSVSSAFCVKNQESNAYIRICTLNANSKVPQHASLDSWLGTENKADIIVIGIQELTFRAREVALGLKHVNSEMERWLSRIQSCNSIYSNYTRHPVACHRMGSLLMIVMVKKSSYNKIVNIRIGDIATGSLGMANKGALAISFLYKGIRLCFINAHLAAGASNEQKRAHDFHCILSNLRLSKSGNQKKCLLETNFEGLFFFGDLNFRMMGISAYAVYKKIVHSVDCIPCLLQYDEYNKCRPKDPFYSYFEESKISFLPSYKYILDSEEYNLKEKNRCPSYTDRILFKGANCISLSYNMHPEIHFSDHRPVSAEFYISMPKTQPSSSFGQPSSSGNDGEIKMEHETIDFKVIKFLESKRVTTSIHNSGQTSVRYKYTWFKYNEKLPRWLMIMPRKGVLKPHERIQVTFDVDIPYEDVSKFNMGLLTISGTLIFLRIHNGESLKVNLQGTFQTTLFGLPLNVLWMLKKPPVQITNAQIIRLYNTSANVDVYPDNTMAMNLITKLLHFLKPGIKHRRSSVYEIEGLQTELALLREMVDNNNLKSEADISCQSVLEMIFIFLIALPKPLIPIRALEICVKDANPTVDEIGTLMNNIPRGNRYILQKLTRQLSLFIDNMLPNELNMISHCLTTSIFRYEPHDELYDRTVNFFKLMLRNPPAISSELRSSACSGSIVKLNRRSSNRATLLRERSGSLR